MHSKICSDNLAVILLSMPYWTINMMIYRISDTNAASKKLCRRLFNNKYFSTNMKTAAYKAMLLTTMLNGSEIMAIVKKHVDTASKKC